jgi:hypothetical protein
MKEDDVSEVCDKWGRREMRGEFWYVRLKERYYLET